jgi:pyruvate/2-oxoglutarate dehydrogenase complex dihydrolipoamide dehydrogenase (E3) component
MTGKQEVSADDTRITARRFVIATGSRTFIPQVAGIDSILPLTNETMFNLTEIPSHLIVIGRGPIGIELA